MAAYGVDFADIRATDAATIAADDGRGMVAFARDFWVAVSTPLPDAEDEHAVLVSAGGGDAVLAPGYAYALVVSRCYALSPEVVAAGYFALDSYLHPQTAGYTLDSAKDAGFTVDSSETDKTWPSVAALARDLEPWATQRRASSDPHPVIIYEEDIIDVTNVAFPARFTVFNDLRVNTLGAFGWLTLQWLATPMLPNIDLDDDDGDAAVVLGTLIRMVMATFTSLWASSQTRAMARFLNIPLTSDLPVELVSYGSDVSHKLAYIELLSGWQMATARLLIVRDSFTQLLAHTHTLRSRVEGCTAPYASSLRLMRAVLDGFSEGTVDNFVLLDTSLRGSLGTLWSDSRSPDDNVTHVVEDIRRRTSRGGGSGDAAHASATVAPDEFAAHDTELERTLSAHFAVNGSLFDAIHAIMHSGAVRVIKVRAAWPVARTRCPCPMWPAP